MRTEELIYGLIWIAVAAFGMACAAAGIWLCFDDALAEIVGIPAVGEFGFWRMVAVLCFIGVAFRTKVNIEKSN